MISSRCSRFKLGSGSVQVKSSDPNGICRLGNLLLGTRREVEWHGGARELAGPGLNRLVSRETHVFTRNNY
jgi:hypothetical protein